jgi:predicted transcriptional regulator
MMKGKARKYPKGVDVKASERFSELIEEILDISDRQTKIEIERTKLSQTEIALWARKNELAEEAAKILDIHELVQDMPKKVKKAKK